MSTIERNGRCSGSEESPWSHGPDPPQPWPTPASNRRFQPPRKPHTPSLRCSCRRYPGYLPPGATLQLAFWVLAPGVFTLPRPTDKHTQPASLPHLPRLQQDVLPISSLIPNLGEDTSPQSPQHLQTKTSRSPGVAGIPLPQSQRLLRAAGNALLLEGRKRCLAFLEPG